MVGLWFSCCGYASWDILQTYKMGPRGRESLKDILNSLPLLKAVLGLTFHSRIMEHPSRQHAGSDFVGNAPDLQPLAQNAQTQANGDDHQQQATRKMNFHADPSRFLRETSDVPANAEGAPLILGRMMGNMNSGAISKDATLTMSFKPRWATTTNSPQQPLTTPHVASHQEWLTSPQGCPVFVPQYTHSAPASTFPASEQGQTLAQAPAGTFAQSRRR
ncbi:hypothetical protein BKA70DRAFT_1268993 [Coprinopsis sp. MPI-PUGE-AT-0042]|nr:hypothetical protein BKA70DRAFT_1268993 [Coprinopsis sp. MPI-PUGE-AT-0042]